MDLFTSLRKASALDRLAELEVEDARRFAARAQALIDVEDVCKAQPDSEHAMTFIALDIATACTVAQSTATMRLNQARHLVRDLPGTWTALDAGELRVGQALALLEETDGLPPEECQQVEALALPRLAGLTSGDTRRVVKGIVVKVNAEASELRRRQKAIDRRVWNSPRPDGRAFVGAEQSAEDAGSFMAALKELARRVFSQDDARTLDQQSADLFAQLPHFALGHLDGGPAPSLRALLGLDDGASASTAPSGLARLTRQTRRSVQAVVLVPVETALGLADNPATLVGYGPITADHARELIAAAELRKACVELRTGRMVALEDTVVRPHGKRWAGRRKPQGHEHATSLEDALLDMIEHNTPVESRDEDQHDASAGLTDFVRLRDTRCVGPGCAMPASLCDLEHLVPHPRGRTTADNLGPASRRCHNAKTHGGWTLQPHPDGSVTWTSPLGRQFTRPSRTTPPDLTQLRLPRHSAPRHEHTTREGDADGSPGPAAA